MAISYVNLRQYLRGTRPQFEESSTRYIDQELKKLEDSIKTLAEAIKELRDRKANV